MYAKIIKYIDNRCVTYTRPLVRYLLAILPQCPETSDWRTVDCYHCGLFITGLSTVVFNCTTPSNIGGIHRIYSFLQQHGMQPYIIYSSTRHISFIEFTIQQQEVRIFVNNESLVAVTQRLLEYMQDDNRRAITLLTLYMYRIALSVRIAKQNVDDMRLVILMVQYFSGGMNKPVNMKKLTTYLNSKTHETCWSILLDPSTLFTINDECRSR